MLRRLIRWLSPDQWASALLGSGPPERPTRPMVYPDDSSMLEDTAYPLASSSMLPLEHDPRSHA